MAETITSKQLRSRFPQLLGKLGRGEGKILLEALERVEVIPDEVLHRFGEQADSLYLIWEGGLALSMPVAGKEVPIGRLGPGSTVGSVAVVEPGPSPVTAAAAEPSSLLRLTHEGLSALRKKHPRVGGHLMQALSMNMAERLRVYEDMMTGRTRSGDPEEFVRLSRPLMGIKG